MSASVTWRGPATTVSPSRRLGQRLAERMFARRGRAPRPAPSVPVIAESIRGLPWTAVRCMWCSTPRMPPSSSPPPARPGPPCTSAGSGEPWPVDSAASSRSSTRSRPCQGAMPSTTSRANSASCGDDRAGQAAQSAGGQLDDVLRRRVAMTWLTGPNASTSCGSARAGVVAPQQHRRQERATLGVGARHVNPVGIADRPAAAAACRPLTTAPYLLALFEAGQRAHPARPGRRGCRRRPVGEPGRDRLGDRVTASPPGRMPGGWPCTSGPP